MLGERALKRPCITGEQSTDEIGFGCPGLSGASAARPAYGGEQPRDRCLRSPACLPGPPGGLRLRQQRSLSLARQRCEDVGVGHRTLLRDI
jgi:hypothetical protein